MANFAPKLKKSYLMALMSTSAKELVTTIIEANVAKLQQSNDCPSCTPTSGNMETLKHGRKFTTDRRKFQVNEAHNNKKESQPTYSWKKMRESTVSLLGTHFGHYKAAEQDSTTSIVNTTMANIPFQKIQ